MAKGIVKGGNNDTPRLTGDAVEANVLSGKTFYKDDARTKKTGTMPERGTVNQSLPVNGTYIIQEGHYNAGQVTQSIPTKSAATITPSQSAQIITAGQYLSGNQTISAVSFDAAKVLNDTTIAGKVGTMPNNGSQTATLQITGAAKPTKVVPAGYTPGGTITVELAAALAASIVNGVTIGGVAGTSTNKKWASGTFDSVIVEASGGTQTFTVNGLNFQYTNVIVITDNFQFAVRYGSTVREAPDPYSYNRTTSILSFSDYFIIRCSNQGASSATTGLIQWFATE